MREIAAIEELTARGIIYTVLIECEAAIGGKTWEVVLSDNHARKGRGRGKTLEDASALALAQLNGACGGQISRYLSKER
jgi:hypothetical protein